VPHDFKEAARFFHPAANKGDADAQSALAQCYVLAQGIREDHDKAAHYFRLAADQGHARGRCQLGQLYLHGIGVQQSHDEGVRYHRLAADQEYPPSLLALGAILIDNEHLPADERTLEPSLANAREGAKLLARAAQCTEPKHKAYRLQALELLRSHADRREVVSVCCIGCGATEGLKQCTRCHTARFCGSACMRLSWRAHKQCCARWAEQGGEDESQQ